MRIQENATTAGNLIRELVKLHISLARTAWFHKVPSCKTPSTIFTSTLTRRVGKDASLQRKCEPSDPDERTRHFEAILWRHVTVLQGYVIGIPVLSANQCTVGSETALQAFS